VGSIGGRGEGEKSVRVGQVDVRVIDEGVNNKGAARESDVRKVPMKEKGKGRSKVEETVGGEDDVIVVGGN